MCRHRRGCLQVERFDERCTHGASTTASFSVSSAPDRSMIGGAGAHRRLPVLAGQLGTPGEEGEVGMGERGRRDLLDKRHLVADRLQLADRFLIVHQDKIGCGKWRLAKSFVQFLAAQGRGSDDSNAVVRWHDLVAVFFRRLDCDVLQR